MRHLAALSDVREIGNDRFAHSKFSRELAANPMVDAFKFMYVQGIVRSDHPNRHFTDGPTARTTSG